MSEILKFKFGETIDGKTLSSGDLVAVNKAMNSGSTDNAKFGSIYKGDKILGTTEADKLVTTEKLTVTGVTVGNFTSGKEIPVGTNVMEVLKQMLMKEINVTANKPSVSIINSGTAAGTYEVGTSVDVTLSHTYTDGSFVGNSGYDYNKAAGCAEGSTSYRRNSTNLTGNTDTQVLTEGSISYDCLTTYSASTNTPVTNFGNNSSVTISAGTVASANKITFTGAYKYFMGYSEHTLASQFDSASVRALTTKSGNITANGTTTIVNATAISSNGKSIVVACPAKYKLATVQNGLGADIIGNFSSKGTVAVTTGTTTTNYTVYVYPITNGAVVDFKNVTLNKA